MKKLFLSAILVLSQSAFGGELDNERELIQQAARRLPGTIVLRTDRNGRVEVLNVAEPLPANKSAAAKLQKAPFVAVNIDQQLTGPAAQEKDAVASTSSWFFAFGRSNVGYGYAYGYRAPVYAPVRYTPYISYAGYRYAYQPYYSYRSGAYSISYCNNPVANYCGYSGCNYYSRSYYAYNPYYSVFY